MSSSVISDLNAEWQALISTGDFADTFDAWCCAWPDLATADLGSHASRFDRKHLTPERVDEVLHALLSANRSGDRYAGRIALQCMLPCISRIAHRSVGRYGSLDEAAQAATAAMWEAIQDYDLDRTSGVSTRIWSRTLSSVCPYTPAGHAKEVLVDPSKLHAFAPHNPVQADESESDILGAVGEVLRLIAWGLDERILTGDEASLLTRLYGDNVEALPSHEIAAEMGISTSALRQRASRAVRRLARAVQRAR